MSAGRTASRENSWRKYPLTLRMTTDETQKELVGEREEQVACRDHTYMGPDREENHESSQRYKNGGS